MLTRLLEALLVSSIGTVIVVALHGVRARHRRRVRVYGPFGYELDGSGALKEISADSFPMGLVETLRQRMPGEVKLPESIMLKKPALVLFASAIFLIQLIILLLT